MSPFIETGYRLTGCTNFSPPGLLPSKYFVVPHDDACVCLEDTEHGGEYALHEAQHHVPLLQRGGQEPGGRYYMGSALLI
jgi:hypothetical protein